MCVCVCAAVMRKLLGSRVLGGGVGVAHEDKMSGEGGGGGMIETVGCEEFRLRWGGGV